MKVYCFCLIFPLFILASCVPLKKTEAPHESYLSGFDTHLNSDGSFRKNGYWDGDSLSGKAQIRISLNEQLTYFYKGGQLAGISPISTGMGGHETPRGSFRITQKREKHKSTLYGVILDKATGEVVNDDADSRLDKPGPGQVYEGAPMDYFMRFNGAVGMHSGFIPGYPASHGCVRMPEQMAQVFFANAPIGTEVKVDY
jgi:lipoprotein-anchoring transpeptidase ErfK/SrfK